MPAAHDHEPDDAQIPIQAAAERSCTQLHTQDISIRSPLTSAMYCCWRLLLLLLLAAAAPPPSVNWMIDDERKLAEKESTRHFGHVFQYTKSVSDFHSRFSSSLRVGEACKRRRASTFQTCPRRQAAHTVIAFSE